MFEKSFFALERFYSDPEELKVLYTKRFKELASTIKETMPYIILCAAIMPRNACTGACAFIDCLN